LEAPDGIEWMQWHPRGNVILAGTEGGAIWMWHGVDGSCMMVFSGHISSCTCGGFTPDGKKIVTGSEDETVKIWNPKTGACELTITGHGFHGGGVNCLAFSSQRDTIITGSMDSTVVLSNYSTGKVIGKLQGHTDSIEAVGFCNCLPLAASGSLDGTLKIWDLNSMQLRLSCHHSDKGITKLCWHPTGPYVYTCAMDGTVCVWDARTGDQITKGTGHQDSILAFDVTKDGNTIITGSDDHTALVFNSHLNNSEKQ